MLVKVFLDRGKLKKLLDTNNLSYKMFAENVGISDSYFSQLLHGKRSPSPKLRKKFEEVLKVNRFSDLFVCRNENGTVEIPTDQRN